MRKALIIMSITVVAMLAYVDGKTRMEELEQIAATTPTQVEMKKDAQKSFGEGIQQKPDVAKNLARPHDRNNDYKIQNVPQKLNPKFDTYKQQTPPAPLTHDVPAPSQTLPSPHVPGLPSGSQKP